MPRLFVLLFFAFAFCASANAAENIYRKADMLAGFPWNEGLVINFAPDEKLCKKHYGARWQAKCAAALGRPGSTARGIKLMPPAAGVWQWRTTDSLVFSPAGPDSLKPGTVYTADLSALPIPSFVKLASLKPGLRTLPLSARLLESRFWIDPSPGGRHRLFMSIQFNFPVPEKRFDHELKLPDGARAGQAEIVWSQNRDQLNISWPISRLPHSLAPAYLLLRGMSEIHLQDGEPVFYAASGPGIMFSHNIPAENSIFNITGIKLDARPDAGLGSRQVLELRTSLQARAGDVLDALEIRQLPEFASGEALKPYDWTNAPAIPADALAKSKVLRPAPMQAADTALTQFRFEIPATAGRCVFVQLDKNLKALGGQRLAGGWHGVAAAPQPQGQTGFLQPGSILPGRGDLDIYGVDVETIEWEAQLVREPFLALLAQASSNAYSGPLDRLGLGMDSLSVKTGGKIVLPPLEQGRARYASLPLGQALKKLSGKESGIALVTLKGYAGGKLKTTASRVIALTGLSLMVKRGANGSYELFAQKLADGEPAAHAEFVILGANGEPVAAARADERGHAAIKSLNGLERDALPVAAVASLDGSMAWLPLRERAREIDFSGFDVGGSHVAAGDTLAFVFSQRGLYRPGDELHFGCLPRRADFSTLPANLPLYAELLDPRGIRVWETTFQAGQDGIAALSWKSAENSLSGRYSLNVKNGREGALLGSASARIESFQPDTIKIRVRPPAAKGWIVTGDGQSLHADVSLQNLYGSPAADHKVTARAMAVPARFAFPGLEQWTFTDPAPLPGPGPMRDLKPARTDAGGNAALLLPAELMGRASAKIVAAAQGYDKAGGHAAADSATFLISPMRQILGYQPAGAMTNPSFIEKGEKASLRLMSVDSDLNQAEWPDLAFSILRRNYVSNLVSDGQGGFRYDETPQDLPLKTWRGTLPAAGMEVALDTGAPGEFLLVIHDAAGHTLARVPYNVAGEGFLQPGESLAGSRMRLRLDRDNYNAGDEIKIAFSLPYDAAGILSIERDGVAAFKHIRAHAGDNVASLRIPADFEGRGHVVAAFTRSTDSDAIYMSPLASAAAPFNANIAARDMGLEIIAPKLAQPGSVAEIAVKSQKPGTAAVFVVDEGILQLTNFHTPSPLNTLLADRALDVSTLQLADLLMPEHGRLAKRLAAFGGGAEGAAFGARFQNPFKRRGEPPVAIWSGLVPVDENAAAIRVPIPAWYNGKVRIMAVGAGPDAAGSAESWMTARGPLVMTPNLPVALAPGDIFEGALVLSNTTDRPMRLGLSMTAGPALAAHKPLPETAELAAGQEAAFPFAMKALDRPGAVEIVFTCHDGQTAYERRASISVRPASSWLSTVQAGIAEKPGELPQTRAVYPEGAASHAMASALPVPLATGLSQYLETYPYGCSEQLISRAFAQVALAKMPGARINADKRQKLLDAARNAISSRFQEGQGVSLWDGGEPDLALTAYAADYLLALRESGLGQADNLLARLCDTLRWNCALNEPTLPAARACAYAIWVLAREGNVVTQLAEELETAIAEKGVANFNGDIGGLFLAAAKREMRLNAPLALSAGDFSAGGWFDGYGRHALLMAVLAKYEPDALTPAARKDFMKKQ